jgi:hypothetical protein
VYIYNLFRVPERRVDAMVARKHEDEKKVARVREGE